MSFMMVAGVLLILCLLGAIRGLREELGELKELVEGQGEVIYSLSNRLDELIDDEEFDDE